MRIRESLSFANTGQLKERLRRVSRPVVLRSSHLPSLNNRHKTLLHMSRILDQS